MNLADIIKNEGGYVFNKNDNGGETYAGISRKYNKYWSGWGVIDRYKLKNLDKNTFKAVLRSDTNLYKMVSDLYVSKYWNRIKGDDISEYKIANVIFDFAVNAGVERATKTAQKILGITVDGVFGKITLASVNQIKDQKDFLDRFTEERIKFYHAIVLHDHSQEIFLNGWISRAKRVRGF